MDHKNGAEALSIPDMIIRRSPKAFRMRFYSLPTN